MKNHMSHEHLIRGWRKQHRFDREGLEKVYSKVRKHKGLKQWIYQF
jgi:hypothetical protein